jgi:hypothetical protein
MSAFVTQLHSFLKRSSPPLLVRPELPEDAELPSVAFSAKEAISVAIEDIIATYERHMTALREVLQETDDELA